MRFTFKPNPSIKLNNTTSTLPKPNTSAKIIRSISSNHPFDGVPKVTEKTLPLNEKFALHVEKNSTLRTMLDDFNPHRNLLQKISKLAEEIKTEIDSTLLHDEMQKFSNLFKSITDPKAESGIYAALGGTHVSGKKNLEYAKENAPNLYENLQKHPVFKDYFPTKTSPVCEKTLEFLKIQAEKDLLHDFFSAQDKKTQELAELFLSSKSIPKTYTEMEISHTLLLGTGTPSGCLANFPPITKKYASDFLEIFRFAARNPANLPDVTHNSPAPKM